MVRRTLRRLRWPAGLAALLSLLCCTAAAEEAGVGERALSLGVAPSHSLVQLEAFYAPLAQYLGEALGRSVRFGTSSSYERFAVRLAQGDFDIVLLHPADLRRHPAYTPLLRFTAAPLLLIVAKPGGEVRSIADLRGKTVALPPPQLESTAATLQQLRRLGIDPDTDLGIVTVPQHNACLQYVVAAKAAACGTTDGDLRLIGAQEGLDYVILDRSPAPSAMLYATGAAVSPGERQGIAKALLGWPDEAVRRGVSESADWLKVQVVPPADAGGVR